ncbi:MAG: hypothetical protein JNM30_06970 [Rhodospirillales bacterium]|nr:hypothetical protein [Rhodospirillales bacterium]
MPKRLSPNASLDKLRNTAKRWLKALRAGDATARARLLAAYPKAPAEPVLRDVQHALAREYGAADWSALKAAVADLALGRLGRAEQVEIVLRHCWQGDRTAALRLAARNPGLARENIYTAVAFGDLAEVDRLLREDPALVNTKGGPLGWEPLLYLAYARLPGGDTHSLAIAERLLDRGADPKAWFDDGWKNPFTALCGIIGLGEGDKATHPRAREFAALLFARGADPYDTQALYNTSITRDETGWNELLWSECERQGVTQKWRDQPYGGRFMMSMLDYLLGNAVAYNHLKRAEWLLQHGANAAGIHSYSGRPLREEALVYGHGAMAALLERHGAPAVPLQGQAAFEAACMLLDRDTAAALARAHSECLGNAAPMIAAARKNRADVVALLLDLGMSPDVMDADELRGIQAAIQGNAPTVVKLLAERGADIDRPTKGVGGGALGFAAHFGHRDIAEILASRSRDAIHLAYLALADRLRELLAAEPKLANAPDPRYGIRPLFCLPDDEAQAADMAALLLAHGADPRLTSKEGETAEQVARKRGLDEAAELLRRT